VVDQPAPLEGHGAVAFDVWQTGGLGFDGPNQAQQRLARQRQRHVHTLDLAVEQVGRRPGDAAGPRGAVMLGDLTVREPSDGLLPDAGQQVVVREPGRQAHGEGANLDWAATPLDPGMVVDSGLVDQQRRGRLPPLLRASAAGVPG
jgi:hypothetical protein